MASCPRGPRPGWGNFPVATLVGLQLVISRRHVTSLAGVWRRRHYAPAPDDGTVADDGGHSSGYDGCALTFLCSLICSFCGGAPDQYVPHHNFDWARVWLISLTATCSGTLVSASWLSHWYKP